MEKAKNNRRNNQEVVKSEFDNTVISIRRVTKVVKGGRTMRFSAFVAVGNRNGKVGIGIGKAAEVPAAIKKAISEAMKSVFEIATVNTTIPHEITGKFGSGKVLLLPAQEGTGVIAGGPARQIIRLSGIKDIRSKSFGTNNAIYCAKATIEALKQLRTVEEIARLRGKTVEEILG